MNLEKVPNFLVKDVSTSSEDRKRLLTDLQLSVLWLFTNGSKPFNRVEARRLQLQFRAENEARRLKRGAKLLKDKAALQRNYSELCRIVGEQCFDFELDGDAREVTVGTLAWNTPIKDVKSGKTICTPRSLLNGVDGVTIGWDTPNFDVKTETKDFLAALRERLEGFEYFFSIPIQYKKPNSRNISVRYVKFYVKLVWSPLSNNELIGKVRRVISKFKWHKK